VLALEHQDRSGLCFTVKDGEARLVKNLEMRDYPRLNFQMAYRLRELDALRLGLTQVLEQIPGFAGAALESEEGAAVVTLMGHGLGGVTAIQSAQNRKKGV